VWCPNSAGNVSVNTTAAGFGSCTVDAECSTFSLYTCPEFIPTPPPQCPDNCSGLGLCVNNSLCAAIDANNTADPNHYPLRCGSNYNESLQLGYNDTCACLQGIGVGYNCGDASGNYGFIGALGGGIIAAIVIAAIIVAALVGGSAAAGVSKTFEKTEHVVRDNPLYKQPGKQGVGLDCDVK